MVCACEPDAGHRGRTVRTILSRACTLVAVLASVGGIGTEPAVYAELARAAERLGYESVWSAEALAPILSVCSAGSPCRRDGDAPGSPNWQHRCLSGATPATPGRLRCCSPQASAVPAPPRQACGTPTYRGTRDQIANQRLISAHAHITGFRLPDRGQPDITCRFPGIRRRDW